MPTTFINIEEQIEAIKDSLLIDDPSNPDFNIITQSELTQQINENLEGLTVKGPVKCATTRALNLESYALSGYTYTNFLTITQDNAADGIFLLLDGVNVAVNDRILIKDETTSYINGIYTLTNEGNGSTIPWVLTRSDDANQDAELRSGSYVFIEQGTVNSGSSYVLSCDGELDISLNEPQTWNKFSSIAFNQQIADNTTNIQANATAITANANAITATNTTLSTHLSTINPHNLEFSFLIPDGIINAHLSFGVPIRLYGTSGTTNTFGSSNDALIIGTQFTGTTFSLDAFNGSITMNGQMKCNDVDTKNILLHTTTPAQKLLIINDTLGVETTSVDNAGNLITTGTANIGSSLNISSQGANSNITSTAQHVNINTTATNRQINLQNAGVNVVEVNNLGLNVNTINERTNNTGVTIDGVLIKDGMVDGIDIGNINPYISQLVEGLSGKSPCRLGTLAPLINTPTYTPNYLDPVSGEIRGRFLATVNGQLTIDGVLCVNADRLLIKSQADPKQNGIYEVIKQGALTGPTGDRNYELLRALDSNNSPTQEIQAGTTVYIQDGTQLNTVWYQTTFNPQTNNSNMGNNDPINWSQISLKTTTIAEGTNLYYTEARVSSNSTVVGNSNSIANILSTYVDKSTNQVIGGDKTFSGLTTVDNELNSNIISSGKTGTAGLIYVTDGSGVGPPKVQIFGLNGAILLNSVTSSTDLLLEPTNSIRTTRPIYTDAYIESTIINNYSQASGGLFTSKNIAGDSTIILTGETGNIKVRSVDIGDSSQSGMLQLNDSVSDTITADAASKILSVGNTYINGDTNTISTSTIDTLNLISSTDITLSPTSNIYTSQPFISSGNIEANSMTIQGTSVLKSTDIPQSNYLANVAPTVFDDFNALFSIGSRWIDTVTNKEYVCVDNTIGAAIWIETTVQTTGGPLTDITVDSIASNGGAGTPVVIKSSLYPDNAQASNDRQLGSNDNRWTQMYSDYVGIGGSGTYGFMSMFDNLLTEKLRFDLTNSIYRFGLGTGGFKMEYLQNTGTLSLHDSSGTNTFLVNGNDGSVSTRSLSLFAGSVSSPAIRLGGDTNTGIYRATPNTINFTISTAEKFRINSSGVSVIGSNANINTQRITFDQGGAYANSAIFRDTGGNIVHSSSTGVQSIFTSAVGDFYGPTNTYKPGGGPWQAICDARLKQNIIPTDQTEAITRIQALNPIKYQYIPEYCTKVLKTPHEKVYNSFIAQEYELIYPDYINTTTTEPLFVEGDPRNYEADGVTPIAYKSIDTAPIQNDMVKICQYLLTQNTAQQTLIDTMTATINAQAQAIIDLDTRLNNAGIP